MSKRKTTIEFIEEAKKVHKDKYDYSKVNYVNNRTKVCIICHKHGEFWQEPYSHLNGNGCKICGIEKAKNSQRKLQEEFINGAKKVHDDKYDYSKVKYENTDTKVCIICPEHGEFWQTPHDHLNGHGCPKCRYINSWNTRGRISTEEFIKRAKEVHGNKYDYSKTTYINNRTKVCIICPKHGEFWQLPGSHIKNIGCPVCDESHIEKNIRAFLENNHIEYVYEKHFDGLKNKSFDFFIPSINTAIECQGIQHFIPIEFFGGEKSLYKQKESDRIKKEFCKKNSINIVYVTDRKFLKYDSSMLTEQQVFELIKLMRKVIK